MKPNDVNITKWFCFTSLILLFCDMGKGKIDFRYMRNVKYSEDEKKSDEDGFSLFPCCSNRKSSIKIKTLNFHCCEHI